LGPYVKNVIFMELKILEISKEIVNLPVQNVKLNSAITLEFFLFKYSGVCFYTLCLT